MIAIRSVSKFVQLSFKLATRMPLSACEFIFVSVWLIAILPGFEARRWGSHFNGKQSIVEAECKEAISKLTNLRSAYLNVSTSSCSVPAQPPNGEYTLDPYICNEVENCHMPGAHRELGPGTRLIYKCKSGYRMYGNADVYCSTEGNWSSVPSCREIKCSSLKNPSNDVSCKRNGIRTKRCHSEVPPGTMAEIRCRAGHQRETDLMITQSRDVTCNTDGSWEPHPIKCVPGCGQTRTISRPLSTNGMDAMVTDFPWHVSLHQGETLTSEKKKFICGGTIIQSNVVLTAAHCVYDEDTRAAVDEKTLFIITGNYHRDYDDGRHSSVVSRTTVKKVLVHDNYEGRIGDYTWDIALLELHNPFELSHIHLPACLCNLEFSEQLLSPSSTGKVAGFGRTVTAETSDTLQTITVPYVSDEDCEAAGYNFLPEHDKFCAGYRNGTAACNGDSGGGLVFQNDGLWYVMGIVSAGNGYREENGQRTCDMYNYALYTKVSVYRKWITEKVFELERNQPVDPGYSNPPTSTTNFTYSTRFAITCSTPPQPSDGEWRLHPNSCEENERNCQVVEASELTPGIQLTYSCHPKFTLKGSADVRCQKSGEWTTIPTCNRNPIGIGTIADQKCMEYAKITNNEKCDIRNETSVDRTLANNMEFPYMAAVGFSVGDGSIGWYCDGTLISELFVFTSASCTGISGLTATMVRVGDLNLNRSEERLITERIPHPSYSEGAAYNDVGLLRLETKVTINSWIRPACLHIAPDAETSYATLSGWNWGEMSRELVKITLSILDRSTCSEKISGGALPQGVNSNQSFCATINDRDICPNSGGSPLVVSSKTSRCMYDVIGIANKGTSECTRQTPTLFTRVSHFVPWIESIVWKQPLS